MRWLAVLSLTLSGFVAAGMQAGGAAPLHAPLRPQTRGAVPVSPEAKKVKVVRISTDPFTNSTSQHKTEVEPDIFSYGATEVTAFQQGRFYDGGGSDIGWATSADGGNTWAAGSLPGITNIQDPSALYDRVTDASVVYDVKHTAWIIASLPLIDVSSAIGQVPVVSVSSDGIHWGNPVLVAPNNGDFMDKSWITCDNWTTSPHFGHCYVEWDDAGLGDYITMSTTMNAGATWSTPYQPGDYGLGGVPQVLPNGTVVVPYTDDYGNISAFTSTDGGKTWGNNITVDPVNWHETAADVRTEPLPSSAIDGGGKLYVAWQDCSFRTSCAENDIVMTTTTDGVHWTQEARIPIDPVTSSVDHFEPGLAADVTTSGSAVHLGLTYYFFPQTNCQLSTCQLTVGFVGSNDGGTTWSAPTTLTKPMNVGWTAQTDQGYMTGDYIATAFSGGLAHGIFAETKKLKASVYNEYMATTKAGLPAFSGFMRYTSRGERPVPGAHSDHPRRYPPPIYHEFADE